MILPPGPPSRKLRLPYPAAIYHGMSRGDHREAVFLEDADGRILRFTPAGACAKTEGQVQACCLRNHHFPLVVETPKANLTRMALLTFPITPAEAAEQARTQRGAHFFKQLPLADVPL